MTYRGLNKKQMALIKAAVDANGVAISGIEDVPGNEKIYNLNQHELFHMAADRYIADLRFDMARKGGL